MDTGFQRFVQPQISVYHMMCTRANQYQLRTVCRNIHCNLTAGCADMETSNAQFEYLVIFYSSPLCQKVKLAG
jgi:hypothetical protein